MKKTPHIVALLIAVCAMYSCQKVQPDTLAAPASAQKQSGTAPAQKQPGVTDEPAGRGGGASNGCAATDSILVAGQTINSGTVSVISDSNFVYVTYTTTNGWLLTQTHLYVGDCALIPVNNPGNPIPGQFPYTGVHARVTEVNYAIPRSALGALSCVCVAAHAVVVRVDANNNVIQQETAWGKGTRINLSGGNWGMKFDYCICTL